APPVWRLAEPGSAAGANRRVSEYPAPVAVATGVVAVALLGSLLPAGKRRPCLPPRGAARMLPGCLTESGSGGDLRGRGGRGAGGHARTGARHAQIAGAGGRAGAPAAIRLPHRCAGAGQRSAGLGGGRGAPGAHSARAPPSIAAGFLYPAALPAAGQRRASL